MESGVAGRRSLLRYGVLSFLLIFGLISQVAGQVAPRTPYAPSSMATGRGLDLVPSNPLAMPGLTAGLPRGSDSIFLSPALFQGVLPPIPNLEIGYLYNFGNKLRYDRLTADYLSPFRIGSDSAMYGEVHTEIQNFWNSVQSLFSHKETPLPGRQVMTPRGSHITGTNLKDEYQRFENRIDLSLGLGYRCIFRDDLLLGVNGFYDTLWVEGKRYSSGSLGLEMAALLPGNDAVDLNFNWYGNLLNSSFLLNDLSKGPSDFDLEAGYSHELYEGGPDLRLHLTGYRFSAGNIIYGWRSGAELTSRNGLLSLKVETGRDQINGTYRTVGGYVNLGTQWDRLLSGNSPFIMPAPVFQSPRNLKRLLSRPTKRNHHRLVSAIASESTKATYVWV